MIIQCPECKKEFDSHTTEKLLRKQRECSMERRLEKRRGFGIMAWLQYERRNHVRRK